MSNSIILLDACRIYGKSYSITFKLGDSIAKLMSPSDSSTRSFTVGPVIRTEYTTRAEMPLLTFFHELSHLEQWARMEWPKTPNFLLNYFVLKRRVWELQAAMNVPLILSGHHPSIYVPPAHYSLFLQP